MEKQRTTSDSLIYGISRRDFINSLGLLSFALTSVNAVTLIKKLSAAEAQAKIPTSQPITAEAKEENPPSFEFDPEKNEALRKKLVFGMNHLLTENNLKKLKKKEKRLYAEYAHKPFALRFILPSIMHDKTRKRVMERLWHLRQKNIKQSKEILEYRRTHQCLSRKELRFCRKFELNREMFASIKETMPEIRKVLESCGVEKICIPNAGILAMLNQTETAGGVYIGDGPAAKQWSRPVRSRSKKALEKYFRFIKEDSDKYKGLRYGTKRVFGSTRPYGAYSGGAVGVQFMPYRLKAAIPEQYKGLNPFDVLEDGQIMIAYYLAHKKEEFRKEADLFWKNDRPNFSGNDKRKSKAGVLFGLWNSDSSQVRQIVKAGLAYSRAFGGL